MDDTMGVLLIAEFFFFQLLHAPFDDFFLGRGGGGGWADEEGRKIFSYSITRFQFPIQFLLGPYI
jgi:hypothetical protein